MAATRSQRRTLPDSRVRELVEEGLGPTAIVRTLAAETGYHYSHTSVIKWKARHGYAKRGNPRELPWKISGEHTHLHWAQMLRAAHDIHESPETNLAMVSSKLPERTQTELRAFLRRRIMGDPERGGDGIRRVVGYDPGLLEGFFLIPPRPGVDNGLVHEVQ